MEPYVVLDKEVGETPLACAEAWRAAHPQYADVSLAYAGRLDPMASGKLLVLIGDECKKQTEYHGLDKEYDFSVLFGVGSDTGDVLGRLTSETAPQITAERLKEITSDLIGEIKLPYPAFSSKTVQGKPLHTWTLEGRLGEIEIPTNIATVYSLELSGLELISKERLVNTAVEKIETIPPVTDLRKAIGNDFRRQDVRADWNNLKKDSSLPEEFQIANFRCASGSGAYMRSLAEVIANKIETIGLAWHIHRTKLGDYDSSTSRWARLID